MRALTTKKERSVVMGGLRPVSKLEKILFPIMVTVIVSLLLPDAASLVGMLMLGNLLKESGQTERIAKAAQNELMNIVTIFLGISVGATTSAGSFLNLNTIKIVILGLLLSALVQQAVLYSVRLCMLLQKARLTHLSVQQVYRQFQWLPVYHKKKAKGKILQTSFLCTLWARMYQVLSVLLLQQVSCLHFLSDKIILKIINQGGRFVTLFYDL